MFVKEEKGEDFHVDWEVIFLVAYTHSNATGVYKRGFTYSKDKEKEFTIVIPIPDEKKYRWGVRKSR